MIAQEQMGLVVPLLNSGDLDATNSSTEQVTEKKKKKEEAKLWPEKNLVVSVLIIKWTFRHYNLGFIVNAPFLFCSQFNKYLSSII